MSGNRAGAPLRRLPSCEAGAAALEFALVAPALILLVFAVIVYSLYFSAYLGIRQAAAEGARAAVAGLSTTERATLATARAQQVIGGYGSLLSGGGTPVVTAAGDGTGRFKVQVSYNIGGSAIMRYGAFLPLPSSTITSSVTVSNGSY
jgi:Flp pilus assembly protein TadG